MKISVDKSELIQALDTASKAISTKNIIQLLQGVLIDTLKNEITVTGNNSEIAIQTTVEAEIFLPGKCVVNANSLSGIVRKMDGSEIDIKVEDGHMLIESGKTKMKIPVLEAKGFPEMPIVQTIISFEISNEDFKSLINKVSFTASKIESDGLFTGVNIEVDETNISAVATDKKVFGIRKLLKNNLTPCEVVLPGKTIDIITKLFDSEDIKVNIDKNYTLLKNDKTKAVLRQITGKYFDYKAILPHKYISKVKVNKKEFLSSIERVLLLQNDERKPLILIADENINITLSNKSGNIDDLVVAKIEGEKIIARYNPTNFADVLKRIDTDEILLNFIDSRGMVTISPVDSEEFLYLITPVLLPKG